MASYLSTSVRAVWSALKADEEVAAYMAARHGHYYEEDETSKKALKLTKSDCPAIIMVPAVGGLAIQPATNVRFDVRMPLSLDLRTEEPDVDTALDIYEMVLRALHAAWRSDSFGVAAQGLFLTEPGAATAHQLYNQMENQLVFVSWQIEFTYTLVFRRQIESS